VSIIRFAIAICAVLLCIGATAPIETRPQPQNGYKVAPLILEKKEGERRVWRPIEGLTGQPGLFILKVDPHNGGSSHLVFGTEDLQPGGKIDAHRHPGSDEILFLQNGRARVSLGDTVREVQGGATVFIPANTWISVTNIGTDAISAIFIFSAPGFEEFMRAESVSEGDKLVPLSKAQDSEILKKHTHAVIYREP
jgi:quercetin dioxygenase-like cupin family protein